MQRTLLSRLVDWKNKNSRKPLLLDGARQVGKSYLIEKLFSKEFSRVHKFDLLERPELHTIFENSLEPKSILKSLELEKQMKIDFENDLIFFDEIGECPKAVNSLKFFCEKMPEAFICASGSNIGLLDSFPVGKTYNLELRPMSFYEFLLASENDLLIEEFEKMSRDENVHKHLWKQLLDYYFVGGMPEAVGAWFSYESEIEKVNSVNQIHSDLLIGYKRDFGKYSNKVNALHIETIFKHIPLKLQETRDGSVKRFSFKNVIEKKKRYAELRGPIDWLEKTNLVSKNLTITSEPKVPFAGLVKENIFKLFLFDIGLLCHSLGLNYKEVISQEFTSKGFIAENFVQCELSYIGINPTYSWQEGQSQLEFILKDSQGMIYPVEVKSGRRTKAQSLRVYREKYSPSKTLKLAGVKGNTPVSNGEYVWPLYYSIYVKDL